VILRGGARPAIPHRSIGGTIAAGLALAAFALASCATPPPQREIDGSADGSRVVLAPGQALRITVDTNPATGYRWVIEHAAAAVLSPVGQPMYTPSSTSAPLVGLGGTMTYDFVAGAPGSDTLQLAYRRPAAKDAVAARSLRVEVVVQ
jgi:inhibitor of cysteine peptidase